MTLATASPMRKNPPEYGNVDVEVVSTHRAMAPTAPATPSTPHNSRPVELSGRHSSPLARRPSS